MGRTAAIIDNPRVGNHDYGWRTAFAAGLARRGWQTKMVQDAEPADLFVIWGVRRKDQIERARANGSEICVLERSYLPCRFTYTSVSFGGGLNGRGEFRTPDDSGARFRHSWGNLVAPWKAPGGYALLIGQVPGDMSIRHTDIDRWYRETAAGLRAAGWDVCFRPHPQARGPRTGREGVGAAQVLGGDLPAALAGAGLVVTFNSNTGVEAALAGVPVIAMDRGSMAWDIAGHAIGEVIRPDRTAWANRLAWCQFTKEEMESGFCQEACGL